MPLPLVWVMRGIVVLSLATLGLGWAASSPIGGSPDDDYHLGSIWCPPPVGQSGCDIRVIDGEERVAVPETVSDQVPCYKFQSDVSGACQLPMSDHRTVYTSRYDAGNYPFGYYQFHHLFVGDSVATSVLLMRAFNVFIAVALLSAIAFLLPTYLRTPYSLAMLVSWLPMGVYFIASNNPSSWSMTGVLAYAAAFRGSLETEGKQRYSLLALSVVGLVLSCTSRADSAFYIFVVTLAMLLSTRWTRSALNWAIAAYGVLASIVGIWIMTSTSVASNVTDAVVTGESFSKVVLSNILSLPKYIAGFWGYRRGPGWFDIYLDGPVEVFSLLVVGMALYVGARYLTWRKTLAALVLAGATLGIPIFLGIQADYPFTVEMYQPRYMFPLAAVFFFIWFTGLGKEKVFTTPQYLMTCVALVIVQGISMHTVLERYIFGQFNVMVHVNLNFAKLWWWHTSIEPMTVFIVATMGLVVAMVITPILLRNAVLIPVDVDDIEKSDIQSLEMMIDAGDRSELNESRHVIAPYLPSSTDGQAVTGTDIAESVVSYSVNENPDINDSGSEKSASD